MAFIVIYDSCVLHPAPLRDFLVRLAANGVVRARWSAQILDECFESVLKARPDLKPTLLRRTRDLMTQAVPDCMVTGFEPLIDSLKLPDPKDRHVLAAAVRSGAQAIVTFNLKDFPEASLKAYDVEALHPDDFVLATIDLSPAAVITALTEQAAALRNPPRTVEDILDTLRESGLVQSLARVRELFGKA